MNLWNVASLDEEEDWLDGQIADKIFESEQSADGTKIGNRRLSAVKNTKKFEKKTKTSETVVNEKDETEKAENSLDSSRILYSDFDESNDKPNFKFLPPFGKISHHLICDGNNAEIPALINRYLRDYQRTGVEFLYQRYCRNEGAILADDMGLGKTIQIIAFLSAIQRKTGTGSDLLTKRPSFLRRVDSREEKSEEESEVVIARQPVLIIAPACVLCNWIQEFDTWGHFSVDKFHGNSKEYIFEKLKRNKLDVVVTTFETFRDSAEKLNSFDFDCVIVDEVHKIKEPKARLTKALKSLRCKKRFGLTGTPLQNNMLELWCILDWANPSCLGSIEQFRTKFAQLIEKGQQQRLVKRQLAHSKRKCEEFGKLRDQWMLRRTKTLIAHQLPKKEDFVLFCPITELQSKAYQSILSCNDMRLVLKKAFSEVNEKGVKVKALMLALLQLLLKCANHVTLLLPRLERKPNQNEIYSDEEIFYMSFKSCPNIFDSSLSERYSSLITIDNSGKMIILERLLKQFKKNADKVLLFSYSVRLLGILERFLVERNYKFRKIDGQTKPDLRLQFVAEFNNDSNIFVFLISTKAGGIGLNITGANRVVIFDPNWNPSHDLQAQDRAYRIGQSRNVEVYRFVTVGTVEEVVYLRQIFKQNIGGRAVESENCKRLFNKDDVFGFHRLFELRLDEPSLTQRLLNRYAKVQKKIANCVVLDYDGDTSGTFQQDEIDEDEDGGDECIDQNSEEEDLRYVYNETVSGDSADEDDVDERKNMMNKLGVGYYHRNQRLIGEDTLEKHIAECADKDVYQLGQHTQEPVEDFCQPLVKKQKTMKTVQNFYKLGTTNIIVGSTPTIYKKRIFSELASNLNLTELELAKTVLNMSDLKKADLLRNFYSSKLPTDNQVVLFSVYPQTAVIGDKRKANDITSLRNLSSEKTEKSTSYSEDMFAQSCSSGRSRDVQRTKLAPRVDRLSKKIDSTRSDVKVNSASEESDDDTLDVLLPSYSRKLAETRKTNKSKFPKRNKIEKLSPASGGVIDVLDKLVDDRSKLRNHSPPPIPVSSEIKSKDVLDILPSKIPFLDDLFKL